MTWKKKKDGKRVVYVAESGRHRYRIYRVKAGWMLQISTGVHARSGGLHKTLAAAKKSVEPKSYPDPFALVTEQARLRSALKDV